MNIIHQLYYAACAADKAYSEALKAEYGSAGCEMRYRTKEQTPAIRALGEAKVMADNAYLDSCRAAREGAKANSYSN